MEQHTDIPHNKLSLPNHVLSVLPPDSLPLSPMAHHSLMPIPTHGNQKPQLLAFNKFPMVDLSHVHAHLIKIIILIFIWQFVKLNYT